MDLNGCLTLIIILALTVGLVFRQLTTWQRRRDSESTLRTDDASGEEKEALRRDSESTSTADEGSGGEKKVLRRDSESTSRTDYASRAEYDVFLSFRGCDTRLNFTDCLYRSMVRAGIRVFLDSEELEDGKEISEILKAVNESRIYIPIFSRNFASSVWCLHEVERMVECHSKSNGKKEFIPIFYDVSTDDVKLRTELYKKAILKHKNMKKFGSDQMERWETALKTVGKIIGRELQGKRQGEEIDSIVEQISRKLNIRHMSVTDNLVEDSAQVEAIMKLLDVGSNGVRYICIHGTGGVGKTTLAKVIFNKLSFHFEGCCFLEDVRASSQPHDGLVNLQKKLLSYFVSSGITDQIKDVGGGIKRIKDVFSNKKVLIVLDDLDKKEQLKNLTGKSDWFCSGSRIIITTREKSIMNTQVDQSQGILPLEVVGMRFDLALRLFYKHAFRSDSGVKEYEDLSREIVQKVGMLPLAVVVIGSHLFDLGNHLRNSDRREVWDEALEKLEEGPFDDVRDTLMISYQQLKDTEKEVFLDISCFFNNADSTYPFIMWKDCGYKPHTTMGVLSYRSLIQIREDNMFWMHDQVRDFGKDIVLREYPHKICRVWIHEKALELLKAKKRNDNVKALSLMLYPHRLTRDELACLPNLRFLQVKELDFSGDVENLHSELRWLSLHTWQKTFHAENFHFSKLVVLDLSGSHIEDGVGLSQMKMNKLKVLDLTGCNRLKRTPDFSNFTSLERLILARCVELTTIDSSIGKLRRLEILNIEGCSSFRELPPEIGSLESLTKIIMPQIIHPLKLPDTFGDLQSLSCLILDKHPGITQIPNSIGGMMKVTLLSLRGCVGIKELPRSIGKMKMLAELDLSKSGIVELPDSIGCLKELKVIRVSYTPMRKFPCTIGQVEMLEELHAKKCWDLSDENLEEIVKLSHLRILDLSYTEVSNFPTVRGCLSSLQTLEMSSGHLPEVRHLPPSLTHLDLQARHFPSTLHFTSLASLDYLELSRLSTSTEEPGPTWTSDSPEERLIHPLPSSLSTLKFRGISLLPPLSNLERLSVLCVIECPMSGFSVSEDLIHLKELQLSKCKFLGKITGLSLLKNLERLDLNRLESLVEIDGLPESLLYFRISHCGQVERLPNLLKLDKLGHIELEACPKIRAIEGLESLGLDHCGSTILKRLTDFSRSTWLSHRVSKNQVFLSFAGPDTCYDIFDCLCGTLVCNRISVFRDDEHEEPSSSDGIDKELPLDDSVIYIPFLSKNYVSSGWHLRKLAHMVECTSKSNGGKKILPIFYDVEVDDIKLESDFYKGALAKHRRKFGNEVEEWEKALREVAGMRVFDPKTSRREVLELVLLEVSCKLNAKNVDMPEYLLEDDRHVEALIQLLDVDSGGVRFVGIHGMSGAGKTTLAKVVFNKLCSHFDGASFLNDIRESSQHGLLKLQKKLLSSFLGSMMVDRFDNTREVMNWIKGVCRGRKVLIVLDDIDKKKQLKKLAGKSNWFGSGSRIIITTRDESLLQTPVQSSNEEDKKQTKGILKYVLYPMEEDQALQLFCNHAFKRDSPIEGYDQLAKGIIRTLAGHPLFIDVIGSYLYCHGSDLEPHGDKRRLWEVTLTQLRKCPHGNVSDKLMISLTGLDDKQKAVFLDIACFFTNEDQTYPVIMWDDCNYHPHSAIRVLGQRSLIKVIDNKLRMHDLVRDMVRYMIRREYSCRFSRVWAQEDAVHLLKTKERNEDVEALSLTCDGCIHSIASEELAALPNLRFLRLKGLDFSGNFENLFSELRWLSWQTWQATFHANSFHFNNLLVLDLSHSNIEDGWDGWSQMKMNRLKVLDLTGCIQLTRTPDFSNFLTLETLILAWCVKLTAVDSSIGRLKLLRTLDLKGCRSLKELPDEMCSLHMHIISPLI